MSLAFCLCWKFSNSIGWWIEEYSSWKVGITPLGKWSLSLEVSFSCRVSISITINNTNKSYSTIKMSVLTYRVELKTLLVVTKCSMSNSRSLPAFASLEPKFGGVFLNLLCGLSDLLSLLFLPSWFLLMAGKLCYLFF